MDVKFDEYIQYKLEDVGMHRAFLYELSHEYIIQLGVQDKVKVLQEASDALRHELLKLGFELSD